MTAQISAHGRIVADVTTRTTANGNQMAMARLAVNLPCNNADEGRHDKRFRQYAIEPMDRARRREERTGSGDC